MLLQVEHLDSISLAKVNADEVYRAVTDSLEKRNIPYLNLVSVLTDSCAVMRGCRNGFEVKLRSSKANHLLDIDGDSVHHANNAAKAFAKPLEGYAEQLFRDIHTDFHYAEDWREILNSICQMLGIRFSVPKRFLGHRFLSAHDLAVDTNRMWDAYTLFYFSFLTIPDKEKYRQVKDILTANMSERSKEKLNACMITVQKRSMTGDGKERKKRITNKIFVQSKRSRLTLFLYIAALEQIKEFVVLFQRTEPQIHILHDRQVELVKQFLADFIKPDKIMSLSGRQLQMLEVDSKSLLLQKKNMFLGEARNAVEEATDGK